MSEHGVSLFGQILFVVSVVLALATPTLTVGLLYIRVIRMRQAAEGRKCKLIVRRRRS